MFYSVKGTCKVFEYMKNYLDIKFEETHKIPYIYTVRRLEINIEKASIDDETLYYDAIKGFLDTLLYFEELDLNINKFELNLDERLENYLQLGNVCYKKINIQGLELAWRDTETNEIVNTLNLTLPESKLAEEINWVDIDSRDEISKLSLMNPVGDKLVRSIDWKENEQLIDSVSLECPTNNKLVRSINWKNSDTGQLIGDNLNFELEPADIKVRDIVWTDMDGEIYDSLILNGTGGQKDLIANCYPSSATMRLVDFYGINDEIIDANRQSATSSLIYISGKELGETSIKAKAKDNSLVTSELPIYIISNEYIRAKKEETTDPDLIYYLDERRTTELEFLSDWKAYSYYGDDREHKTVYYCSKPLEGSILVRPIFTGRPFYNLNKYTFRILPEYGIDYEAIRILTSPTGNYNIQKGESLIFSYIKFEDEAKAPEWRCFSRNNIKVPESDYYLLSLLNQFGPTDPRHYFMWTRMRINRDNEDNFTLDIYTADKIESLISNGID